MDNSKVFAMKLSKVYPLLVAKAERKGRTRQEVETIVHWLTGYDAAALQAQLEQDAAYGDFFQNAPAWNEKSSLITGTICGCRVEAIEDPLMYRIRCLDKLIDELAKGRPMEKILRK